MALDLFQMEKYLSRVLKFMFYSFIYWYLNLKHTLFQVQMFLLLDLFVAIK